MRRIRAVDAGMKLGAAGLILAVINFIAHEKSFPMRDGVQAALLSGRSRGAAAGSGRAPSRR